MYSWKINKEGQLECKNPNNGRFLWGFFMPLYIRYDGSSRMSCYLYKSDVDLCKPVLKIGKDYV